MALSQRMGIIECWFGDEDGYGFIRPEGGGEAVFVHRTSIAAHAKVKALNEGARVTYEVVRKKMGGVWARDVRSTDAEDS